MWTLYRKYKRVACDGRDNRTKPPIHRQQGPVKAREEALFTELGSQLQLVSNLQLSAISIVEWREMLREEAHSFKSSIIKQPWILVRMCADFDKAHEMEKAFGGYESFKSRWIVWHMYVSVVIATCKCAVCVFLLVVHAHLIIDSVNLRVSSRNNCLHSTIEITDNWRLGSSVHIHWSIKYKFGAHTAVASATVPTGSRAIAVVTSVGEAVR